MKMNVLNLYLAMLYGFWIISLLNYSDKASLVVEAESTFTGTDSTSETSTPSGADGTTETITFTGTDSTSETSTPSGADGTYEATNSSDSDVNSTTSTGEFTTLLTTTIPFYSSTKINVCNNYCKWPWPNTLGDVTNCACPAGSLNIKNNCCLSQNWIIGLAVGCGGFAILSLSSVIAYLCCCQQHDQTAEDRLRLKENEMIMDGVDTDYFGRDSDRSVADVHVTDEGRGAEDRHEEMAAVVINTSPGPVHQPYEVLIAEAVHTAPAQNGNVVLRTSSKARQQQQQQQQRPVTYEERRSDIYKEFVPRLDIVDVEKDYSIRRPAINI